MLSLNPVSGKDRITQTDKTEIANFQTQPESNQSDTVLVDIQSKIYNAFIQAKISQKYDEMANLSNQLEDLYKAKGQNLILYWRSYLQYYSSIYYIGKGDKKMAEDEIDKSTEWMESVKKKNSEDYALLAMIQSFSIQFKGMKAMFISGEIKKNAKSAISLDSTNLRAYYVYASNDFYTPEIYGGGKEAEKYLLKAITLPAQKIKNSYLPYWGKEESYEMLIKLYIRNEKWDQAKKYFREGIAEFPKSYIINLLASILLGK